MSIDKLCINLTKWRHT